ncbi:hypothetical protein D3C81_1940850 [compost metagenome]
MGFHITYKVDWQFLKQGISRFRKFISFNGFCAHVEQSYPRLLDPMHLLTVHAAHQGILCQMFRLCIHIGTQIQRENASSVYGRNDRSKCGTLNSFHSSHNKKTCRH